MQLPSAVSSCRWKTTQTIILQTTPIQCSQRLFMPARWAFAESQPFSHVWTLPSTKPSTLVTLQVDYRCIIVLIVSFVVIVIMWSPPKKLHYLHKTTMQLKKHVFHTLYLMLLVVSHGTVYCLSIWKCDVLCRQLGVEASWCQTDTGWNFRALKGICLFVCLSVWAACTKTCACLRKCISSSCLHHFDKYSQKYFQKY